MCRSSDSKESEMSPSRLLKGAYREIKCFQRMSISFLTPKHLSLRYFSAILSNVSREVMTCTIDFMAINIRMKMFTPNPQSLFTPGIHFWRKYILQLLFLFLCLQNKSNRKEIIFRKIWPSVTHSSYHLQTAILLLGMLDSLRDFILESVNTLFKNLIWKGILSGNFVYWYKTDKK